MSQVDLSFELFPPKNPKQEATFWRTVGQLETFAPSFVSLTRGALGASTDHDQVLFDLHQAVSCRVAGHITTRGANRDELSKLLGEWHQRGIRDLVALRGDGEAAADELPDATALVELAHELGGFDIKVAGYPETHPKAQSRAADIAVAKAKVDAGASEILTQFFFEADDFLRYRDDCAAAGIDVPVVPGILPIADYQRVRQFAAQCGATVPDRFEVIFEGLEGNIAVQRDLGVDLASELCDNLNREGVERFHIYTLNIPNFVTKLAENLVREFAPQPIRLVS